MHLALGLGTKEMLREKDGREERGGGEGDIAIYFRFARWLSHAVKEKHDRLQRTGISGEGFPKDLSTQLRVVSV